MGKTRSPRSAPSLVMAVLTAVTDRRLSPKEGELIDRIEEHRLKLIESNSILEYVDYGAGSPTMARTAEQMYAGVSGRQTVGQLTKIACKDRRWASLLFRVVRETRPERLLEMGAAVGISGSYQAAALELNGTGKLVTIEGGEAVAEVARDTLKTLRLDHRAEVMVGRFQDVLPRILVEHYFDYVFVDGHHDGDATRAYFRMIVERLERPRVIVFDDIRWSSGMLEAWKDISGHPAVSASFDVGGIGIVIAGSVLEHPLRSVVEYM